MRLSKPFMFAMLLLVVIGLFWFHLRSNACSTDTASVPTTQGSSVAEIVETSCDVSGGSNVIDISIISLGGSPASKRVTVFEYEPSSFSGPVSVTWVNRKELAISIDRVDMIEAKETQVAGYTISYHIGAVGPY